MVEGVLPTPVGGLTLRSLRDDETLYAYLAQSQRRLLMRLFVAHASYNLN